MNRKAELRGAREAAGWRELLILQSRKFYSQGHLQRDQEKETAPFSMRWI